MLGTKQKKKENHELEYIALGLGNETNMMMRLGWAHMK